MKLKLLATFIILFTASAAALSLGGLFQDDDGEAALVKLSGTITPTSSGFGSTGITPESVREVNQKVRNGEYDAVIYEINSGGGAVVASKDVKRSIKNMDIPTVCRFRDISASGAYLIAMGCDRIVADSATITGSVGVTSSYLEFSGTLDRLGIQYVNITAGEYKEVGSQYMNASEREKQVLKDMALDIQDEFIGIVQKNRNLTEEEVQEIETASIFLGEEARNLSMVDSLGGRAQAVDTAEQLTGKDLQLKEIQKGRDLGLLSLFLSETGIANFFTELGFGANTGLPLSASY
jgi:protease-4